MWLLRSLCRSLLLLKHWLAIMFLYSQAFSVETEVRKERRHARQTISMHTETRARESLLMQHRNLERLTVVLSLDWWATLRG